MKLCGCFSASAVPSVTAAVKRKAFLVNYQCVIASLPFLPSPGFVSAAPGRLCM